MPVKTIKELLDAFNKAGKKRKETIASNAGFQNVDDYRSHLENQLPKDTRPVIHTVTILDASGSMSGDKFNNALNAVNKDVEILQQDSSVEYRYSRVVFSGVILNGNPKILNRPIDEVTTLNGTAIGGTPLYKTISSLLSELSTFVKKDEKVIVNIFTDGDDTHGGQFEAAEDIAEVKEKGWTITFIGTKSDVFEITRNLALDESNTLVHDNTAAGVARALEFNTTSKLAYSKAVVSGATTAELQSNFYKRTGKL